MLTKRFTEAKVLPLFFWFEVVEVSNLVSFSSSRTCCRSPCFDDPILNGFQNQQLLLHSLGDSTNSESQPAAFFSTAWEIQWTMNLNQQPQPVVYWSIKLSIVQLIDITQTGN